MMPRKVSDTAVCVLWAVLLTLSSGSFPTCAAAARPQANCSLSMQGFLPVMIQGVASLNLHCNTSDGLPLQIGVNATWIDEKISNFSGVSIQPVPPECSVANLAPLATHPTYSLLYFCSNSHDVMLQDSYVHALWWDGDLTSTSAAHLLMFGPNVTAQILRGIFQSSLMTFGAVVCSRGANLVVSRSLFEHKIGSMTAAAIWASEGGTLNLQHSSFLHHNASWSSFQGSRGAAVVIEHCKNATISDCTFYGNMVHGGFGSAVVANRTRLDIYHSNFTHNVAQGAGGACAFYACEVGMYDSWFVQNSALRIATNIASTMCGTRSGLAGAVGLSAASVVRMYACTAVGNYAEDGAGFVGVELASQLYATGCVFVNNSCGLDGNGGVIATDTGGIVAINNCTAKGNTAAHGGVVSAWGASSVMVSNHSLLASNTATKTSGAIDVNDGSNLVLSGGTLCSGNAARQGGAVGINSGHALIVDSILDGNSAFVPNSFSGYGGAIVLIGGSQLDVVDSVISNNNASWGGGGISEMHDDMDTLEPLLVLDHSYINNNSANQYGGGLHVSGGSLKLLNGSRIFNNTATVSGGGVRLETERFVAAEVQAATHGNHAAAGMDNDINVLPSDMPIAFTSPNQPGLVTNLSADGSIEYVVNVTGYQGVPTRDVTLLGIIKKDDEPDLVRMLMNVSFDDGVHLQLTLAPGNYLATLLSKENRSTQATFPINLTSCNRGQISDSKGLCQRCNAGSYSISKSSSYCHSCPAGAQCPGGAVILPESGYWRSSALSDQVHRCPNPTACQHGDHGNQSAQFIPIEKSLLDAQRNAQVGQLATDGTHYAAMLCSQEYHGNLCGVCKQGYGSSKPFTCRVCMNKGAVITLYAVGAIVLLGLIHGLCVFTLREATADSSPRSEVSQPQDSVSATDLLKPLVLYFQYLLILVTSSIQWPASFAYPLRVLAWTFSMTSPGTLSVDCLFSASGLSAGVKKTLFYLCAPVVMMVALLLLEYVLHLLQSLSRPVATMSVSSRLASNAIVVVFFFLPSVVRTTFSLLACVTIDESSAFISDAELLALGRFWLLDLQQTCFEGYHRGWALGLGIPLLIIACVAWPAFIIILTSSKRKAHDATFARHYSFLYHTYTDTCTFWEGVVALQTTALVAVSVFGYSVGSYYQIMLLALVMALICLLLVAVKPFAQPIAQRVMELGIVCLLGTSFAALALFPNGYVQGAGTSEDFKLAIGVILVAANFCYVAYVCRVLCTLIDWDKVRSIWNRLWRRMWVGTPRQRSTRFLPKACEIVEQMQTGSTQI